MLVTDFMCEWLCKTSMPDGYVRNRPSIYDTYIISLICQQHLNDVMNINVGFETLSEPEYISRDTGDSH